VAALRRRRNAGCVLARATERGAQVAKRRRAHQEKNPDARIISLGIGDTTEPIPAPIAAAMEKASAALRRRPALTRAQAAAGLGTVEGYSGYGAEQGQGALREALAAAFYPARAARGPRARRSRAAAQGLVKASELFVSDGSKCDITRLQLLLGPGRRIALQDPSYPAYVDSSVIVGQTRGFDSASGQYGNIAYLPCTPQNGFFPDLAAAEGADVIFFCSPNNPTGNAATREQLTQLVAFAKRTGALVIYDAACAPRPPPRALTRPQLRHLHRPPGLPAQHLRDRGRGGGGHRDLQLQQVRRLHGRAPGLDGGARGAALRGRHARDRRLEPHHDHLLQRRLQRGAGGRAGLRAAGGAGGDARPGRLLQAERAADHGRAHAGRPGGVRRLRRALRLGGACQGDGGCGCARSRARSASRAARRGTCSRRCWRGRTW